jgi:hypothetical protein
MVHLQVFSSTVEVPLLSEAALVSALEAGGELIEPFPKYVLVATEQVFGRDEAASCHAHTRCERLRGHPGLP